MKIIDNTPTNWHNLQDTVCRLLNEAGYYAESPKTIETVRGKVEVDVYAEAENELLKRFICECKFWNKRVPKEKVHAFRTVVADSGSSVGIMITKNGFQKGAIEAAYSSNVLLKDWEGFLELIENQWLRCQLLKIKKKSSTLSKMTRFTKLLNIDELTNADFERLVSIGSKRSNAMFAATVFDRTDIAQQDFTLSDGVCFCSCSELFAYINEEIDSGIAECSEIYAKYNIDISRFSGSLVTVTDLDNSLIL